MTAYTRVKSYQVVRERGGRIYCYVEVETFQDIMDAREGQPVAVKHFTVENLPQGTNPDGSIRRATDDFNMYIDWVDDQMLERLAAYMKKKGIV